MENNGGNTVVSTAEFSDSLNRDIEAQRSGTNAHSDSKSDKPRQWNHKVHVLYCYYIAPYIRMPFLLILSLWLLMISGNLTAIRNNSNKLFDMRNIDPVKYGPPDGPPEDRVNYVLPDLAFSTYGLSLQNNDFVLFFLDGSPTFALTVMVLFLLYFRDPFLFAEVIWIESFMNLMKAPAQLMTSMPDPYGQQAACWDPKYGEFGSWVFTRWSVSFCGDCIWSYHTWHWIFPMLYIHRFLRTTRLCTPHYLWIFRVIVTFWTIGLVIVIVFIQFHYSVDVFIAIFLSIFVLTHTPFVEFGANLLYLPPSELVEREIKAMKNVTEYEPPPYERMDNDKQGDINYGSLSSRPLGTVEGVSPINEKHNSYQIQATSPNDTDDDFIFLTTNTKMHVTASKTSPLSPTSRTQEIQTGN